MKESRDKDILDGILKHDRAVLNSIYEENLAVIERLVIKSGGRASQAKDILQEGMIIIFHKVNSGTIKLSCKFNTYLYSICKHLLYQELNYGDRILSKAEQMHSEPVVEEPEINYRKTIFEIFDKHFDSLSDDCRKILRLHFNQHSTEEIKNQMGYRDKHYVMDKKYRCKKSLVRRIMRDPIFKNL